METKALSTSKIYKRETLTEMNIDEYEKEIQYD